MDSKVSWTKTISRPETPIRSELLARGSSEYVIKILGVATNNYLFNLEKGNGSAYFDLSQMKKLGEVVATKVQGDPSFLQKHIDHLYSASENLLSVSKKVTTDNLSSLRLEEIKNRFNLFIEAHLKFSPYMTIPVAIEKVMTNIVKKQLLESKIISGNEGKLEFYLSKLLTSSKLNQMVLEIRDFAEIVKFVRANPNGNYKDLLKEHQQKYGWLAVYSPNDEPYSLEYYEDKLKSELANLDKKSGTDNDIKEDTDDIVKKLELGSNTVSLINFLREYIYLRTFRVEQLCRAYSYVQPLFKEIAKRANVSLYELCLCSLEEIRKFLDGGYLPNSKEIESRKSKYLYIVKNGNFKLFSGKNAEKVFLKEIGAENIDLEVKEIKGNSASKGIGKGKAHIILRKNEIPDFKNGEVLVTIMTNPDFVVIMKKAVAIVTDEGGVLCHAAIVSRELDIPCVVGTRVATKVLKNGDIVEVDAFKGVVRKV